MSRNQHSKKRRLPLPLKPPQFKPGDRVRFHFVTDYVTGQINEDRGEIGVGGRRLYGIHFVTNPPEVSYIEMPEEELAAAEA